ncbi:MAG: WXG100 family type VII secretion target [Frankiaceae bacterium]|jgi:WXG100 family type VII secretion target|nr:WXG100 family type VII secretion target [Frankiaceae bacterium]
MSGFKVAPEQLQTLGGQCAATANSVRDSHSSLRSQLQPVLGSEWTGAAQLRFSELYQQFETSASRLVEALDGIGQLLAAAGRNYAAVEESIAGSFAA